MNKLHKYIILTIMIVLIFAQIFCINNIKKANNIKVYNTQNELDNYISLKQFNEDLNRLKEKTILSANEVNGKWFVKVKINGNNNDLVYEISKLKNYDISNYVINKNKDENCIILEISAKKST
jgi:hypothetical protein